MKHYNLSLILSHFNLMFQVIMLISMKVNLGVCLLGGGGGRGGEEEVGTLCFTLVPVLCCLERGHYLTLPEYGSPTAKGTRFIHIL